MLPRLFKMIMFAGLACLFMDAAVAQSYVAPATEELEEPRIFPFNYDRIDVRYDLFLNLADTAVAQKYSPVFDRYKLPFNGETWEGVLQQMLERIDRGMARHIRMMPEDEGVYLATGNKSTQQKFLREILPVLSNTMLLEKHLQRLDRNRLAE